MNKIFAHIDPDVAIRGFLGFVFVGVGLLFTFLIGQVATLSCERVEAADRCVLRHSWMDQVPLRETPVEGLNGARVEESCDDEGCTYRVLLVTTRQSLPLNATYSSGRTEKEETAAKINEFVQDKTKRAVSVSAGGGLWLLFPLIFVAVGIGITIKPLITALGNIFRR